jgi:hypothetical protein
VIRPVSPGVTAVHGLWIGPPTVAVVLGIAGLLAPAEGLPGRLSSALFLSGLLGVVWAPAAAVWGCAAGALSGIAARLVDRPGRSAGRVLPLVLPAAAVGAGAGWTGTLLLDVPPYGGPAAVVVWGVLTGSAAVAVERRGARRAAEEARPRWASALAGAAAVLTVVAWLWTAWVSLQAEPFWEVDETCGPLLGLPSDEIGFASGGFPLQGWCLGDNSEFVPTQPVWHVVLATALGTAAALTLVGLVARRLGARRSRVGRAVAGTVLAVVVGAGAVWGWATATARPSEADWQQFAEQGDVAGAQGYGEADQPPASSTTTPEPEPSESAPPVSGTAARTDLEALRAAAQDAGGPELLWPEPLAVVDVACAAHDGTAGVRPSLTGRFTTRDLATAVDGVDFLSITQDNEDVAARIVQAWSRDGLGTPEPLHGEWWQGPTPDGRTTVEIAHVGFEEGVGVVQVDAACATRP